MSCFKRSRRLPAPAVKVLHHPDYVLPLPAGHPFPMAKYAQVRESLLAAGIVAAREVLEPDEAARADLARVHDAAYLDKLFGPGLGAVEQRLLGVPWSTRLLRRSRLAVQGTLEAARLALQDGFAGNLAGGTHHAFADHGELAGPLPFDGGDADEVIAAYEKAGFDVQALAGRLQQEGKEAFADSWDGLIGSISGRLSAA